MHVYGAFANAGAFDTIVRVLLQELVPQFSYSGGSVWRSNNRENIRDPTTCNFKVFPLLLSCRRRALPWPIRSLATRSPIRLRAGSEPLSSLLPAGGIGQAPVERLGTFGPVSPVVGPGGAVSRPLPPADRLDPVFRKRSRNKLRVPRL